MKNSRFVPLAEYVESKVDQSAVKPEPSPREAIGRPLLHDGSPDDFEALEEYHRALRPIRDHNERLYREAWDAVRAEAVDSKITIIAYPYVKGNNPTASYPRTPSESKREPVPADFFVNDVAATGKGVQPAIIYRNGDPFGAPWLDPLVELADPRGSPDMDLRVRDAHAESIKRFPQLRTKQARVASVKEVYRERYPDEPMNSDRWFEDEIKRLGLNFQTSRKTRVDAGKRRRRAKTD